MLFPVAIPALAAFSTIIPSSDPGFWFSGRTQVNSDGTRSFDWEGVSINFNIEHASYVSLIMNTSGPTTRITASTYLAQNNVWFDHSTFWVSPRTGSNTYWALDNLDGTQNYTARFYNSLEPSFSGSNENDYFTFVGIQTDGMILPPTPFTRKIEIVGDSISAGYGAMGGGPCPVTDCES
jgi:hypothetical protein